ncbi:hypothetical protein jhhlp_005391 [Lomentospora prolificans]|uniref:Uncharacterized protein n=1 Tax=Lomentospora prolificans TaxID=41688 RepID=A0A2N3N6R4_9PEZI|nr:hypothetical protein jhhlp_005391 [Lomentospora prolificans]
MARPLSTYLQLFQDLPKSLQDPELHSRPTVPELLAAVTGILRTGFRRTLLAHDNPNNIRLRKSVAAFFVPSRLERFEPLLLATAHDLIDGFADKGHIESKSQFALPLRRIVTAAGLDPSI